MKKRISLTDLIEKNIIKPNHKIYSKFKGNEFIAKIDKEGFVILDGKRYTSLSIAAGNIKSKINGKPKDGRPYIRVNGWSFWKYKNGSKIEPMDNLRQTFHKIN